MKLVCIFAAVIAVVASTPLHPREFAEEPTSSSGNGNLWAVLIAGSSTYYNYRHQADVCHAYQVLHSHGVPDDRIVVMMYDDIANNEMNPTKGVLINHPDGGDVYKGVIKDYTGDSVTPQNFLNVLQGNKAAMKGIGSGKVLETGPNDRIFVYFSDHGATGLVAFPNDILTAEQLNDAIKTMFAKKQYGKMVMYIEACESGSMFDGILADNMNVYVTTAASPDESSYACYWDDLRETYLGDVYSVKWLEDSDAEILSKESLEEQYSVVKKETTTSQVEQYGNISLASTMCSEFQGTSTPSSPYRALPRVHLDAVNSREVPLAILRRRLDAAVDEDARKELENDIEMLQRNRQFLKDKIRALVKTITAKEDDQVDSFMKTKLPLKNRTCYETVIRVFHENCFDLAKNSYALAYTRVVSNLCESGFSVQDIKLAIEKVCTHPKIVGIV